jgi:hypothetical protein
MPAIIALVLLAIVALAVRSIAVHVLFFPWLLMAIAIVAWMKVRPRRSRQYPRRPAAPDRRPTLSRP